MIIYSGVFGTRIMLWRYTYLGVCGGEYPLILDFRMAWERRQAYQGSYRGTHLVAHRLYRNGGAEKFPAVLLI